MPLRPGFQALQRAVEHAGPPAVDHAADLIARQVAAEAPRLSGDLARSVEVVPQRSAEGIASAKVEVSGGHDPREFVGSVEFGDHDQVANPFVRRGTAAARSRAVAVMKAAVSAAIVKQRLS